MTQIPDPHPADDSRCPSATGAAHSASADPVSDRSESGTEVTDDAVGHAAAGSPDAELTRGSPDGGQRADPRRLLLLAGVALIGLGLDILSKQLVLGQLSYGEPVRLIPGVLWVQLTRNPGAAFGIGTGVTWAFAVVAVLVIVVIARSATRLRSRGWAVALGLLLGGAVGNLLDRLFRAPGVFRGWVVDWIRFRDFPWNFNIADSCITIGGVIAVLLAFRGIELTGQRHTDHPGADQASADHPGHADAETEAVPHRGRQQKDPAGPGRSSAAGRASGRRSYSSRD